MLLPITPKFRYDGLPESARCRRGRCQYQHGHLSTDENGKNEPACQPIAIMYGESVEAEGNCRHKEKRQCPPNTSRLHHPVTRHTTSILTV
ncbi:MAG TPA: hypothetical protein VMA75_00890 [Candidatus Paceibacterota bacterium]|nr:hypothetical protein [Candidatus Paceibacterota bacterium]